MKKFPGKFSLRGIAGRWTKLGGHWSYGGPERKGEGNYRRAPSFEMPLYLCHLISFSRGQFFTLEYRVMPCLYCLPTWSSASKWTWNCWEKFPNEFEVAVLTTTFISHRFQFNWIAFHLGIQIFVKSVDVLLNVLRFIFENSTFNVTSILCRLRFEFGDSK